MFPLLFICLSFLQHCVPHWDKPFPSLHLTCLWKSNIHPLQCTSGRSWGALGRVCHLKSSCPLGLCHLVEHRSHPRRRENVLVHHHVRVPWVPQVYLPPGVSLCWMVLLRAEHSCSGGQAGGGKTFTCGHQNHPGCRMRLRALSCPLGPPGDIIGGHITVTISGRGCWRDGGFTL